MTRFSYFAPLASSLALLASAPGWAAAPVATKPAPSAGCSGEAARPATLNLNMGKSTMLRLPERVANRSVGNPNIVQAMLVAPDTLYIAGVDVGSTNMIVQGKSGLCSVVDIVVAMDPPPCRPRWMPPCPMKSRSGCWPPPIPWS